ncbi:hypothetical protein A9974_21390 [Achromobacter sp. UMC71]|nr:hypothetical protein [Achromobacter sp. UMC71]
MSIAGAQEKAAFLRFNGRWCRPHGATSTIHIFKMPLGLAGNTKAVCESRLDVTTRTYGFGMLEGRLRLIRPLGRTQREPGGPDR